MNFFTIFLFQVIYACCQVSTTFCSYISNQQQHMESLLGVLMGKVELADMEVNSVIEMLIHVLSTIVIQLQTLPPTYVEHFLPSTCSHKFNDHNMLKLKHVHQQTLIVNKSSCEGTSLCMYYILSCVVHVCLHSRAFSLYLQKRV